MAKTKGGHRRPKGEGSIQVMPNGNYKMTISIGVGLDGKQKRKSITASSKPILMSKVAKLRVSLGQDIQHSSTPKLFKDVAKQWLESKEGMVSTNSYISYTTTYKSFFYLFDSYRIDKITSDIIDEALMSVKGTKSNRRPSVGTLIGYKRVLGVFFNYAVDKQYIATSPMKRTMTFSKRKQKVDLVIPTKEELKGILQDAKKFDKETKDYTLQIYPLFLLATATGMRLGEMLNLRHSDIDMNTNTIFIKAQTTLDGADQPLKTESSQRKIYVNPNVLKVLSGDTEFLFNIRGKHAKYQVAATYLHRYFKDAKVPERFTMHSFRHYHATELLLNKIGVKEVSKRLGHSDIQTTLNLYAHWIPEMDTEAARVIDDSYI